jgi:beta-galactosidase
MDAGWRFMRQNEPKAIANGVPTWLWIEAPAEEDSDTRLTLPDLPPLDSWHIAAAGSDVFHGRRGFAWFQHTFTQDPPASHGQPTLHFESVDDNATVYLNGVKLIHHEGWNDAFDVTLAGWRHRGRNVVTVLVENTDGAGGIGAAALENLSLTELGQAEASTNFNDAGWRVVHLPHDFVIEGTFSATEDAGHGALPKGQAWYRKSFSLPAADSGKSVWVDFDGVFSDAKVWFNGVYLGEHRSGYTGFRFDLAKFAHFGGKNVLAVHVDARKAEGWWYEGGGIYRHVWLTITDPVHITPLSGVYVTSTVEGVKSAKPTASIQAWVGVDNSSDHQVSAGLRTTFTRPDGSVEGTSTVPFTLAAKQSGVYGVRTHEPKAELWSLEHPQLYNVRTEVVRGAGTGKAADAVDTLFGVRTIRFDAAKGFFLNERPVKLKGTCNHQDFIGVGIGMPDSVLTWRIKRLKAMGSNAYRCSHNEVASDLLDACDRLGMLVMDENREFGDTYSGKATKSTTTNNLGDITQEVLRDRNHPSIVMWSIANEEFGVQTTPAGARIGSVLVKTVHGLDPTRPVTAALNGGHNSYLSKVLDLEGFNYGPQEYSRYHKIQPDHPAFASETASTVTDRGIYAWDRPAGHLPAYDTQGGTAESSWKPVAEDPYIAGAFVWTGFDYKGEPSPLGWPDVNSHFGIMDMCGFPKDNWFYYKAWWGGAPLVHVFPHWDWPGKEGQDIDVWAFANGDEVELFLNGKSLGRKTNPAYEHVSWKVPYVPGRLEARTYRNGRVIATDAVETTGTPVALKVTTSRTKLVGDNEDTTMLEVSILDSKGRVVPVASNEIHFSVTGPAWVAGVGNGDPACHEPDRSDTRHAFNGWAMGLIQAKNRAGKVVVTISSPGLRSATVVISIGRSTQS